MDDKYSIKGDFSYNEALDIAVRLCAQLPDTVSSDHSVASAIGKSKRAADQRAAVPITAPDHRQRRVRSPGRRVAD